ncbi:hypothetical protein N5P18_02045 [Janibacter terrae]|uniref:DUF559 domain-containing protein n=1 Tax=Janibacter terrae TaxID=103817 RepID=A0ABZ2FEW1_9MICO
MLHTYTQLRIHHTRREIEAAVATGTLVRAGRYYALAGVDESLLGPLRRGARPTCLTAARHHGIWTPPGAGRHVYTRRAGDVPPPWVTHGYHHEWPEDDPIASPALLLEHAARCLDPLDVGVLADSALHLGLLHDADVVAISRHAPRPVQPVLARASRLAESGTESRVRLHLQLGRVPVQPQAQVVGVGRVDLLVGRSWIIECDSRAHHADRLHYVNDRGRDGHAVDLGYFTSRLTYDMCFAEWDATVTRLARVVASGQHLVPPEERIRARRVRR